MMKSDPRPGPCWTWAVVLVVLSSSTSPSALWAQAANPAFAQQTPKAEVFGGYSYFRSDGGGNLHGWNASVAGNLNHWFGVDLDVSGHYNSESSNSVFDVPGLPILASSFDAKANIYNVLVGPRFSFRKRESVTPFAHALFGVSRAHVEGTAIVTGPISSTVNFSDSDTSFAAAFGGGLDLKLGKGVSLRVLQADYLLTTFGSDTQHNARISAGLVFRFGKR